MHYAANTVFFKRHSGTMFVWQQTYRKTKDIERLLPGEQRIIKKHRPAAAGRQEKK